MYKGTKYRIPAGLGGFNGSDNLDQIPKTDLSIAKNLSFDGKTWRKIPGAESFDANVVTGSPTFLGGIDWHPNSTTQRIISAWSDGSVYRENGGDLDAGSLAAGLSFSEPAVFVTAGREFLSGNRKLFLFSAGIQPRFIDGDAAAFTLVTPNADWSTLGYPSGAIFHDYRLYAWTDHILYPSSLDPHESFTSFDPPPIPIYTGESERIACCFGFLPNFIYIFKYPFGIYRFNTETLFDLLPSVEKLRDDIGMAGPKGIARVKNDVWFISNIGHIHSLTAVLSAEDIRESDITANLKLETFMKENVDLSRLKHAQLIYDPIRQEVSACFSQISSDRNNIRIVIDVSTDQPKIAFDDRGTRAFESLFLYQETNGSTSLFAGGIGGRIYRMNIGTRSFNGGAYESIFRTIERNPNEETEGSATKRSRFDWLEFVINPTGNHTMSVDVHVDGIKTFSSSVLMSGGGAALGSFILGTSILGGREVKNKKIRIAGVGERIAIKGYNSTNGQDFAISEVIVHHMPLGESGQK